MSSTSPESSAHNNISTSVAGLETRLAELSHRGVVMPDPRQVYVSEDVDLSRIEADVVLHPGTRLIGARSYLAAGVEVGAEGPATVINCALASGASLASGYAKDTVLLEGASAGAQAHLRAGTLLEEQASTAHCVGLKQTILLSFVTLGSLINFCDCLMAGGRSRSDHSEVGSGFIHFNYTPWGDRGDKATPSLIGDVVSGVFLDQPRIFLGGSAGMVGPRNVGFGSVAVAGEVLRRDVEPGRMVGTPLKAIDREFRHGTLDRLSGRTEPNYEYIAQLAALRAFYTEVRLARAHDHVGAGCPAVLEAAIELLSGAIAERIKQFNRFRVERGAAAVELQAFQVPTAPKGCLGEAGPHVTWVQSLSEADKLELSTWIRGVRDMARTALVSAA